MAILNAWISDGGANVTLFGVGDEPGARILISVADRSGGETVSATVDGQPATLIHAEPTLSTNSSARRSCYLLEFIIPSGFPNNPVLSVTVLDGSETSVDQSFIAIQVEEDDAAGYTLSEVISAHSDTSTTTSQTTGTTSPASPASDLILVAVETTRGATTATWGTTSNTPPNPGGGDWSLLASTGSGTSQKRMSMGYASLTAQPSQTWSDVVSYGTSVMASAILAVFVKSEAEPPVEKMGSDDITLNVSDSISIEKSDITVSDSVEFIVDDELRITSEWSDPASTMAEDIVIIVDDNISIDSDVSANDDVLIGISDTFLIDSDLQSSDEVSLQIQDSILVGSGIDSSDIISIAISDTVFVEKLNDTGAEQDTNVEIDITVSYMQPAEIKFAQVGEIDLTVLTMISQHVLAENLSELEIFIQFSEEDVNISNIMPIDITTENSVMDVVVSNLSDVDVTF